MVQLSTPKAVEIIISFVEKSPYYWDKVAVALHMSNKNDAYWGKTTLALHMDQPDPYWANTALALHMNGDPFWNNVVLAMHMEGAEGGTVFTDMKSKVMSVQGSVTTRTGVKKVGTSSGYFPGIGSDISTPITTDFILDPNVGFTIECFCYHTTDPIADGANLKVSTIFTIFGENSITSCNLHIMGNSSVGGTGLLLEYSVNGVTKSSTGYTGTINKNQWYHIAICASATDVKYFIDGALVATSPPLVTALPIGLTGTVRIGRMYPSGLYERTFIGYIDELRITKGVARYNTSANVDMPFLDNSFIDEKAHAVTLYGTPALSTSITKFGKTSGAFNGSNQYLQFAGSSDFAFGTGDFTIESWVYLTSYSLHNPVVSQGNVDYGAGSWTFGTVAVSGFLYMDIEATSTASSSTSVPLNSWNHVCEF